MRAPGNQALFEAETLITHLLTTTEAHRTLLAREVHDELGGLVVSAIMDLSSALRRLPALDSPTKVQFDRIQRTLEDAVDRSRRMVEELRPSILDNFGLFAALQWQLKKSGRDSNVICTEAYPDIEPRFAPNASIALFRIAQEALGMVFARGMVKCADLTVRVENGELFMKVTDDGIPVMSDGEQEDGAANALVSMRQRLRAMGGQVDLTQTAGGVSVLTARLPLHHSL
jgi:signal transduction histidine kinase